MSELDQAWAVALADAEARARATGRADIREYIELRTTNDLKRRVATDWLLAAFTGAAGEANRNGASIEITNVDGHRFSVGSATMVGRRLTLQHGVRALSIEIGWPRTPRDGFIRGGGLALASVAHLGMKSVSEQYKLIPDRDGKPHWRSEKDGDEDRDLHEADIKHHVSVLLTDSRNPPSRA